MTEIKRTDSLLGRWDSLSTLRSESAENPLDAKRGKEEQVGP